MAIRITNIQRFCLNDGPGIRTTVFLKGCNLHCPWCANPENLSYALQYYYKQEQCRQNLCDKKECCLALQNGEGFLENNVDSERNLCSYNAIGIYGQDYSTEELLKEILKDEVYMQINGGVTFSGGEALLQIRELEEVLMKLKEKKIHIAIETALFVSTQLLEIALEYVDFFYVDVKILETNSCKEVLGADVDLFKKNVKRLTQTEKEVVFRVPGNRQYTLTDKNIMLLKEFFCSYSDYKVELFQVHNLAESKYNSLGKQIWKNSQDATQILQELSCWLKEQGIVNDIVTIG